MTPQDGRTFWFRDAVVYQIWPASYKDSNNDGIGDIQGIISTLDYVASLGVNTIWLSPMYRPPQIAWATISRTTRRSILPTAR